MNKKVRRIVRVWEAQKEGGKEGKENKMIEKETGCEKRTEKRER